jgi:uncharacterized protein
LGKILLFLVVLFVALFALRLVSPRTRLKKSSNQQASTQDRLPVEPMVACATCGALVPKSEAVLAQGKEYCSREHAGQ